MSNENGKKALIKVIAIAVATFVEYAVTEALECVLDWAGKRKKR